MSFNLADIFKMNKEMNLSTGDDEHLIDAFIQSMNKI